MTIAFAVACLPIFFTRHINARWEGAPFVALCAAYTICLILTARQCDSLDTFHAVITYAASSLVSLTLAVLALHEWRVRNTHVHGHA